MPTSTRIPPILQPSIQLPQDDTLLLLTSTLGASANWLVIRFICDALKETNAAENGGGDGHNVVLVSWMREFEFWKQEARKGVGLDLERLRRDGRFAFVDGLSASCLDASNGSSPAHAAQSAPPMSPTRSVNVLPSRGPPGCVIPARGSATASPTLPTHPTISTPAALLNTSKATKGHTTLSTLDLTHFQKAISDAISLLSSNSQRKTLIILDNPDLLLALNPTITPYSFSSTLLTLHTLPTVTHILTHIQADHPLLSLSTPPQPLELGHHNLLVKCAHMSRRIVSVRVLDTGVARDVSGVVRITEQRRGFADLGLGGGEGEGEDGRGKEFLYQVKGDGSVRVFERGAGGDV